MKEDVNRFNNLYENHLRFLKLQGKAKKTLMPMQGNSQGQGYRLVLLFTT
jgi:hypothetical protein